jgi:hypothetical protein
MRTEAAPAPPLVENYLGFPEGQGGQRLLDVVVSGDSLRHTATVTCSPPVVRRVRRSSLRLPISSLNVWDICPAVEGRGAGALI